MRCLRPVLPLALLLLAPAPPARAQLAPMREGSFLAKRRPLAAVEPERRVQVCHLTGGLEAELLFVTQSMLSVHLEHGDFQPVDGQCIVPTVPCDGIAALPCPEGSSCWDLPWLPCGPGLPDCPGYCGRVVPLRCSATGGCPAGTECFDDPSDDCDPDCGDVGCPTACAAVLPFTCDDRLDPCFGGTCADVLGDGSAEPCDSAWSGQCVRLEGQPCSGWTGLDCTPDATCAMDGAEPPSYAGECVIPRRP